MTPAHALTSLFSTRCRADGCNLHLVVFENGVTLGSRPGRGRLVTWTEILRVAEGPPADRFGVVVNGRLQKVFEEEFDAQEDAANQRQLGVDALVIRVPLGITS